MMDNLMYILMNIILPFMAVILILIGLYTFTLRDEKIYKLVKPKENETLESVLKRAKPIGMIELVIGVIILGILNYI